MYFTCLPLITILKTKESIEKHTHTQSKSMDICSFITLLTYCVQTSTERWKFYEKQSKTKHSPLVHWFIVKILRKRMGFNQMDKTVHF